MPESPDSSLSIRLDTTDLAPEPDTPLKILLEGSYHKNEVWSGAEKKDWLGLFHENGAYVLRPAKLEISTVHDPVLDEEHVRSGREVKAAEPNLVFFLTGLQHVKHGAVDTAHYAKTVVAAGKDLTYTLHGKAYTIHAYGDSLEINDYGYSYKNYGWKVSGMKQGKTVEQKLTEHERFDASVYVLLWAGDLDRDGIPDLLLDLSNHYNVSRYALFLSSGAGRGKLYKKMAEFEVVGS